MANFLPDPLNLSFKMCLCAESIADYTAIDPSYFTRNNVDYTAFNRDVSDGKKENSKQLAVSCSGFTTTS